MYYSQKELEMSLICGVLAHFECKIYKDFWTISSLYVYVLNCFRYFLTYILKQNLTKIRQEKFLKELDQVFM